MLRASGQDWFSIGYILSPMSLLVVFAFRVESLEIEFLLMENCVSIVTPLFFEY